MRFGVELRGLKDDLKYNSRDEKVIQNRVLEMKKAV